MSANYSTRSFFRHVPNAMLLRYFKSKNVLQEYDFSIKGITETKIGPIFDAWKTLPPEQLSSMEKDFQEINAMACERGVKAIIDEADWHGNDIAPILSEINGFYEKVFWVFLERNQYWNAANLFNHADNINQGRWREWRISKQLPAKVDSKNIKAFENNLSNFFYLQEGRGKNCTVEVYKRGELDYFFAYPEDYSSSAIEWDSEALQRRTRHPAFEVIFVYSQEQQKISLHMKGVKKDKEKIRAIFADAILGLDINEFTEEKQVYDLEPLEGQKIQFQFTPDSGIQSVAVKKLRLRLNGTNKRITIEADPTGNQQVVYELKDKICQAIPQSQIEVDQVGILVTFLPDPTSNRKSPSTRVFEINYPSTCTLQHDGRDALLRKMLKDSGIEPQIVNVTPKG